MGDIYLDVPYDKDLLLYQALEAYLQYPDDRMRFDNVKFFYQPRIRWRPIRRAARNSAGCGHRAS